MDLHAHVCGGAFLYFSRRLECVTMQPIADVGDIGTDGTAELSLRHAFVTRVIRKTAERRSSTGLLARQSNRSTHTCLVGIDPPDSPSRQPHEPHLRMVDSPCSSADNTRRGAARTCAYGGLPGESSSSKRAQLSQIVSACETGIALKGSYRWRMITLQWPGT
jgi:hypothetical protein